MFGESCLHYVWWVLSSSLCLVSLVFFTMLSVSLGFTMLGEFSSCLMKLIFFTIPDVSCSCPEGERDTAMVKVNFRRFFFYFILSSPLEPSWQAHGKLLVQSWGQKIEVGEINCFLRESSDRRGQAHLYALVYLQWSSPGCFFFISASRFLRRLR